jgi:ribonuclease P protein subunit RPR2
MYVRSSAPNVLVYYNLSRLSISHSVVSAFPSHGHAVTYTCTSCKTCRRIPAPPTLLSEHVDVPVPITGPSTSPSESQPAQRHKPESIPADLHPPSETLDSRQNQTRLMKKKKPPPTPRLPPFFARDVGHVVFRGNERLPGS